MVDKKTFIIGVLSLSAVILLVANIFAPHRAIAADSIRDNDYSLQTARAVTGGDCLYVTDNHTGLMAVFTYNPNAHKLESRDVQPVQNAFSKVLEGGTGTGTRTPGRTPIR